MNGATSAALGVVLAAVVTGLVTWFVARRTKSGKVDTTEAATLWDEGSAMRRELRDELSATRIKLAEAVTAITDLNHEIKASRAETERSREETRKSRAETRRLMEQIEELRGEVQTSNALTLGQLGDNIETRRILAVPKEDRSKVEDQHLATAGDRLPEKARPHISPEELADNDPGGHADDPKVRE